MLSFPPDFYRGCATSALQIEGATQAEGRTPSIWDEFCHNFPERIHQGASPEPGCAHYQRMEEDLDWIAQLGHNAYRFSISWTRVMTPEGKVNPAGLDFYDRLVEGLCQRQVAPMATLYHWDLPAYLKNWENPQVNPAFLNYVSRVGERLGDRVSHWMTLNEPAWSLMNGYVTGLHPPAVHDLSRAFQAAHQQMQAHHGALRCLRDLGVSGQLGLALNLSPVRCGGPGRKDRRAARWADWFLNRWFLEAAILGRYPREAARLLRFEQSLKDPQTLDFLGVNYYYPKWVTHSDKPTRFHLNTSGRPQEKCQFSLQGRLSFVDPPAGLKTDWDWEIDPQGLADLLLELHHSYPGLPLMVTENGLGLREEPGPDLEDQARIDFIAAHLQAIGRAREGGAPVLGYLYWSLLDNFSWLNGYHKRYGLLSVCPHTQQRFPKRSASWFREIFCAS